MDTLKAKIAPVDQSGYLTANEQKDLFLFLYNGETAEAINALAGPTWETSIVAEDGGVIIAANAAHTVLDDGVDTTLRGKLKLVLTAAQFKRLKRGREIAFAVKLSQTTPSVKTYWGKIDEVREGII